MVFYYVTTYEESGNGKNTFHLEEPRGVFFYLRKIASAQQIFGQIVLYV